MPSMWDELRRNIPTHIRLHVTGRFVELACSRCGWLDVMIREKVTPERTLTAAQGHRCPPDKMQE